MIDLATHRCHDFSQLVTRWRRLARRLRLPMEEFGRSDGYPLLVLESHPEQARKPLYLSTGIHGDEPAGPEALLRWSVKNEDWIRSVPCMIFPCLNPWGLIHNSRFTARGLDVNRSFHQPRRPVVGPLRRRMNGRRIGTALMLHEDYDGCGLYLYEVCRKGPSLGRELLDAAADILPPDPRARIDGHRAKQGLLRRRIKPGEFPELPEALWLYEEEISDRSFTVETPSEFGLDRRVEAQVAVLDALAERVANGTIR